MQAEQQAFIELRNTMQLYAPLTDETWSSLKSLCKFKQLSKNSLLYRAGEIPQSFSFVYQGLFRCYASDEKGNEYNKMFFNEGMLPGSMSALLTSTPSILAFEAIENSTIIEIDFTGFRKLLVEKEDLKLYQIYYLEKNWLLAKDIRETQIVQEDATIRYLRFVKENPKLVERLAQYHIASHLGITPTQLSYIRKHL